jgi:acetyl esterase/lipase
MAFTIDPELQPVLAAAAEARASMPAPPAGDPIALRTFIDTILNVTFGALPFLPEVEVRAFEVTTGSGKVPLRLYRKKGSVSRSVVVYAHGGGMVAGSVEIYDRLLRRYVDLTGVSFLAVDYRLAPEHRANGLAHDVFAALVWLMKNAAALGIDPAHVALMGDSGGGGVAAGAAILARDAGLSIKKQILIYPMLDNRNVTPDPLISPFAAWTYEFNKTAWNAVHDGAEGAIEPSTAPARLKDFNQLAPSYIEVGELDIFRDECIDYMQKLLSAGVSCEFHLHAGAPHLFEGLDWASSLSATAFRRRARAIMSV